MVIGVAGRMGSGKDTIAEILVRERGYRRIAMADALRDEVADLIMRRHAEVDFPESIVTAIHTCAPEEVWQKPTTPAMRHLLQWWGVWRRSQDPDYWVKIVQQHIRKVVNGQRWVVPDIRFPNEAAAVRDMGGEVWLVTRKQADADRDPAAHAHISEKFCCEYSEWDVKVCNDRSLEHLQNTVIEFERCARELHRLRLALPGASGSERDGIEGGIIDWERERRDIFIAQ